MWQVCGPEMTKIGFRLTGNTDPEERLEEAAMWKAMKDVHGDLICAVPPGVAAPSDWILFGRGRDTGQEPVSSALRYWLDPAFVGNCGRRFDVVAFDELAAAVERLHADGHGAFLKSTRAKHWIARVSVGADLREVVGDMAYSFMDGGPEIMVQEECDIRFEYRCFVVDREIVTFTPIEHSLTPAGGRRRFSEEIAESHMDLARSVASRIKARDAVIDVGLVNGKSAVVELNPMQIGQVGLYASSVRALANASVALVNRFRSGVNPGSVGVADVPAGAFLRP